MSTPEPTCACGQPARRVELSGPVRMETTDNGDGTAKLTASQPARWYCDDHWPHGAATIMRIEGRRD